MVQLTNLLTDVEAARTLRLSVKRLLSLARAGRLRSVDLGDGELRFDPEDLIGFVNASKTKASPRAIGGEVSEVAGMQLSLR